MKTKKNIRKMRAGSNTSNYNIFGRLRFGRVMAKKTGVKYYPDNVKEE
jgi:hypothetical protein